MWIYILVNNFLFVISIVYKCITTRRWCSGQVTVKYPCLPIKKTEKIAYRVSCTYVKSTRQRAGTLRQSSRQVEVFRRETPDFTQPNLTTALYLLIYLFNYLFNYLLTYLLFYLLSYVLTHLLGVPRIWRTLDFVHPRQ